jgi:integrase
MPQNSLITEEKNMITKQIVFDHRGRTKAGQEGPIEVRITHERKPYYINTGIKVLGRQLRDGIIVGRGDADVLNERLDIVVRNIEAAVNSCIEDGLPVNVAEIRRQAYGVERKDQENATAMIDWIEREVPLLKIKDGTRERYEVLVRRMRQYGKLASWQDLTVENLYRWDAWLHTLTRPASHGDRQAGRAGRPVGDAAVYNYHRTLRSMLARAVKFKIIESNPYELVRGEFRKGIRENLEYLTDEEMQAIVSLRPMAGSPMCVARDLFVFQLYTGMSYSDTQRFDIRQYKKVDGVWTSNQERVKTGVAYVSVLLPPVVEVLERYGMQAPKMGNADYNHALKAIGLAAGVATPLHSHLARHSFATRAKAMGIDLANIARMLGHTNTVQTQRYAKVMPEQVFADLRKIERLSTKKYHEGNATDDVRGAAGGSL